MKKWIVVSQELKTQLEQSNADTPRRFVTKSLIPGDKKGVHAFEVEEKEALELEAKEKEKAKQGKPKPTKPSK